MTSTVGWLWLGNMQPPSADLNQLHKQESCCSPKVAGAGCFGASLMLEPELVAACCTAMAAVTSIPVTVKCRLGASHTWRKWSISDKHLNVA